MHSASSRFALLRSAAITFPAVLELDPQSCAPTKCFPSLRFIKKTAPPVTGKTARMEWRSRLPIPSISMSPEKTVCVRSSRMAFQVSSCRLSQRFAGGMLTDQQVAALAQGIVRTWGSPGILAGQNPPPYVATQPGDPIRGQQAYATFCARCHGAAGEGAPGDPKSKSGKLGSIVDSSYLALISDQNLRSMTIAGLPDRDMPDWRSDLASSKPAQAMTSQQVTDIVAWLASKRSVNPGQPYPTQP